MQMSRCGSVADKNLGIITFCDHPGRVQEAVKQEKTTDASQLARV